VSTTGWVGALVTSTQNCTGLTVVGVTVSHQPVFLAMMTGPW